MDHRVRRASHGLHRQRREQERHDGSNDQPHHHIYIQQVEGLHAAHLRIGRHQRQRSKHCRADGETLTRGSRRVAQGVECIRPLAHFWVHVGLLRNTAGIVGYRPVGVRGQRDTKGRQHADRGQRHTVDTCKLVGRPHRDYDHQARYQRAHHS